MASTQTVKNNSGTKSKDDDSETKYKELPEPTIIEAWFQFEEGASIEGVIMERGESDGDYGPRAHYALKTVKPCKAKSRDGIKTFPIGSIIGVNENAKLRQLKQVMKETKGAVQVRIVVDGARKGGPGWDMTVNHKAAF